MWKTLGIALGAGVTSAVLFAVTRTATPAGLVLSSLTPLPIMIAGLGFASQAGAAAALIGGGAVSLALNPTAGLVFFLALGMPGWLLARQAQLRQPSRVGALSGTASEDRDWYPIPPLMMTLAALASLPVLLGGAALIWWSGGYEAAVDRMTGRLAAVLMREHMVGEFPLSDVVRLAPVMMAATLVIVLATNLWLAGRTVKISDRLERPWPDLPTLLRLPRLAAVATVVLLGASFLPDPFGLAAAVVASAFGTLFVFEGLGTIHAMTRGLSYRAPLLAGVYLVTALLMPWPPLAWALLGLVDSLFPRTRQGVGIRIIKVPKRKQ